ncbi:hypothetical protein JY651_50565 [Pyxidicoccus parkwayensis]|uniref:Lipoprotein n=1 Tax=Pyxidicoccus parkwayensis TaxID=2813578 RepID=A0ABX7NXQ0_9BACT|nr:hypothetical protein [Pyxidicoccus parkwaysis]QSQ23233.1 hypothetical protein JY651_50565 [Pyxidicoccus parkwaysis]
MKYWLLVMLLPLFLLLGACGGVVEGDEVGGPPTGTLRQELTPCLMDCYQAQGCDIYDVPCQVACRNSCAYCENSLCQDICMTAGSSSEECLSCINTCMQ